MVTSQYAKKNLSGQQVIKTLMLLMDGSYTMHELIEKLNENESEPIFNNSVISKYINTCRFCGIEIPQIHNKYFVARVPFGLEFSVNELKLLENLASISAEKLALKSRKIFHNFIIRLNRYSNKDIIKIQDKTQVQAKECFNKAILDKRQILLFFKSKITWACNPLEFVEYNEKPAFKVLYQNQEKIITIDRVSGISLYEQQTEEDSKKLFPQTVIFRLTGALAQRYSLRENEVVTHDDLPNSITISNDGEDEDLLLRRLLRYDKDCEIIRPYAMREKMKILIDEMLSNYED